MNSSSQPHSLRVMWLGYLSRGPLAHQKICFTRVRCECLFQGSGSWKNTHLNLRWFMVTSRFKLSSGSGGGLVCRRHDSDSFKEGCLLQITGFSSIFGLFVYLKANGLIHSSPVREGRVVIVLLSTEGHGPGSRPRFYDLWNWAGPIALR